MMDNIWWNHIIKARKLVDDIVFEVIEGNSVLLSVPHFIPWKNTLIDIVSDRLQLENSKNKVEIIQCPNEIPGTFLLNRFCKEEIRAKYRYGISYAKFLGRCQETVLNDRYIWITGIPVSRKNEWVDFVSEYNKNVTNKTPGIFILEITDESGTKINKKGIKNIIFNQTISEYDKYAFCALVASETKCKEYMRPYLAEVVASVCDDVELAAACVSKGKEFLQSPYKVMEEVAKCSYRSDGEVFKPVKTKEEIDIFVWEAQLKYVFPLVESYRKYFVNRYLNQIKASLPINNGYGDVINTPEEVEIGTLLYLVGNGSIAISTREYDELERYRDARNKLAHINILSNDELDFVLHVGKHK